MINWLSRFFFANWRTKGVALFFAISIWFLAYQSETRKFSTTFTVRFVPRSPELAAIVGLRFSEEESDDDANAIQGAEAKIDVVLVGPRKQIDGRSKAGEAVFVIPVERDQNVQVLEQSDFQYPDGGVTISEIRPKTIYITQADVQERVITELETKIDVMHYDSGKEVVREILEPKTGELRIRGPESEIRKVSVEFSVSMNYRDRPVETEVEPRIEPEDELLLAALEIWDFNRESWVPATRPPKVKVRVRLEETKEVFLCDAAKLVFQLPLTQVACKVTLLDTPPGTDTIPVKFEGPKTQIDDLKEAYQSAVGITLSVPPPPAFHREKSARYTFSEDNLVLEGYPDVRVQRHDRRREELRAFWSYDVTVFVEKEEETDE